jgi:hypothetical protein
MITSCFTSMLSDCVCLPAALLAEVAYPLLPLLCAQLLYSVLFVELPLLRTDPTCA